MESSRRSSRKPNSSSARTTRTGEGAAACGVGLAERGFQGRNSRPSPPVISVDGYQLEVALTAPRGFDRRMDMEPQAEMERRIATTTSWGWIAGAIFVVIILALIFVGA